MRRTMASALEVEIKLLPRAASDLDALARRARFGAFGMRPRGTAYLHSTYVDTREGSLLRHGVALRLREQRGRWEMTAKSMGRVRGALHERPEHTVALVRRPSRTFRLPRGRLHEQLDAIVAGRALVPIFVTEIERSLFDVVRVGRDGSGSVAPLAEMALDRVRIVAPGRRARVLDAYAEVEIELRAGTRADVLALGRRIAREFHMTPATESKFSRGVALCARGLGTRRPVRDAPTLGDTLGDALRTALAEQLARIRANDPDARRGESVEAVHQMRVAARRARAALRLFAGGAPPRVEGALDRELRWLGSELGAVRDLDVQIAWVEQERRDLAGNRARAFGAFVADLRRLRAKRQTHLRAVLSSARYHHLLVRLERFADGSGGALGAGAGRAPVATVGADRLATAIETLCRRGRRVAKCAGEPSAEDLHALRIRAKRVRYALEFLAPFTGAPGHALVKRLVALQDILGAHQDAVVAAAFVRAHRKRGARSRALAYEGLLWATRRRAARARARFRGVFREFDRPRARRDARETIRAVRAAHTGT